MIENGKEIGSWLHDNEPLLYKMVWNTLRRLGFYPSPQDVEFVVADAMWRMWEYRHLYTGGNLQSWVSSVVRSSCIDVLREYSREKQRKEHYVKSLGFVATTPSHETTYVQRETASEGLAAMTPQQRQAVLLHFIGYDYHEVAHEMGLTWVQVKNAIAKGRMKGRDVQAST